MTYFSVFFTHNACYSKPAKRSKIARYSSRGACASWSPTGYAYGRSLGWLCFTLPCSLLPHRKVRQNSWYTLANVALRQLLLCDDHMTILSVSVVSSWRSEIHCILVSSLQCHLQICIVNVGHFLFGYASTSSCQCVALCWNATSAWASLK